MALRRGVCKLLRDGARRSFHSTAPTSSCMAAPHSVDSLRFCGHNKDRSEGGLDGSKGGSKEESLLRESLPFRLQRRDFSGTYGVGPVEGADRDPKSKGDTPDDFRADYIHMAEPKEVTKEKAAAAMDEPPDFQAQKIRADWDKQAVEEADSQREPGDKVFEEKTKKLKGTAKYEGDTEGTEGSGHEVQGQYGGGPPEGKTNRA